MLLSEKIYNFPPLFNERRYVYNFLTGVFITLKNMDFSQNPVDYFYVKYGEILKYGPVI